MPTSTSTPRNLRTSREAAAKAEKDGKAKKSKAEVESEDDAAGETARAGTATNDAYGGCAFTTVEGYEDMNITFFKIGKAMRHIHLLDAAKVPRDDELRFRNCWWTNGTRSELQFDQGDRGGSWGGDVNGMAQARLWELGSWAFRVA
ncbi:hypothetical protein B0H12DRAFT_1081596 [Mycena haematopus]|nr:hypothetical protein B0H12DRAFT_1081596 [Mycena haematopus]